MYNTLLLHTSQSTHSPHHTPPHQIKSILKRRRLPTTPTPTAPAVRRPPHEAVHLPAKDGVAPGLGEEGIELLGPEAVPRGDFAGLLLPVLVL